MPVREKVIWLLLVRLLVSLEREVQYGTLSESGLR
jgi:hypothetical protein